MNSILAKTISTSEGRYLQDLELHPFESFANSFGDRFSAYCALEQKADACVLQALRQMAQRHPEAIRKHGKACQRDMSYVLRQAAIAMLKNDEQGFTETLVLWMQNIMTALDKHKMSAEAYQLLQKVIETQLLPQHAQLINHYLQIFVDAMLAID